MWILQDAKNQFSAVVEAALAGQPQEVTRRGKLAVVVLSAVDYARICKVVLERRGSFMEHLLAFPSDKPPSRSEVKLRNISL